MTSVRRSVLAALVPAVLALAVYFPSLRGRDWTIDDPAYIVQNRAVTQGAPLAAYFFDRRTTAPTDPSLSRQVYRPLRTLAYRAIAKIFGLRTTPFAVANLALYLLSVLLVGRLVARFTQSWTTQLAATALWALLPVHVEAVQYLSALGDNLSFVLELAALLVGMKALAGKSRATLWGALSTLLVAAAMLAKEMAILEPALLLLLGGALLGLRALRSRRALVLVALHAIVLVGCFALRTHVLGRVGQMSPTVASVQAGLYKAPVIVAAYAWVTVAAMGHTPGHVVDVPKVWQDALAIVGIAAAVWLSLRSRRAPLWLGVSWFLVSLLPVLRIVPLLADVADRFALVPSVGVALVLVAGWEAIPNRLRMLRTVGGIGLAAIFAEGVLLEAPTWQNDGRLWRYAVGIEPDSAQAHNNLAAVLLKEGKPGASLRELERAGELGFNDSGQRLRRAVTLYHLGRLDDAQNEVATVLCDVPDEGSAHALLGALLRQRGQLGDATRELALAKRFAPEHPFTEVLNAQLALSRGRADEALPALADLAAQNPLTPGHQYLYASALLLQGDAQAALRVAEHCRSVNPSDAQCLAIDARARVANGILDGETRTMFDAALAKLPTGPERTACLEARAHLVN